MPHAAQKHGVWRSICEGSRADTAQLIIRNGADARHAAWQHQVAKHIGHACTAMQGMSRCAALSIRLEVQEL